ncbi:1,2-phenylacetyl-CoA epoxidase subunit PaaC [Actinoplanes sp. CA-015351]|uniref:1,2-phenylacetyl-CoA epoxidase subunit PaaC n=1 Tax=Actinoplanes sp. CA-015351 TaxID=3239897 RepID=UPI003D956AA5
MAFDDAYSALTDHDDDARWAYGTGFSDPLAAVPSAVPADVDGADLSLYCLMLGDDALILSHRLQEWVTRAPELEDELAIANIALDLLGQARLLLSRAGTASGPLLSGSLLSEDALAFGRDAAEFRNVCLAERPDADFACLVGRLLVMVTWRLAAFDRLSSSHDPMLAAIAAKGVKELTYHRDYAAQWVVRLGDGTALSHARMASAMAELLPLTGELFATHPVEARLADAGVAVDPVSLRAEFDGVMAQVLEAATLDPALPVPLDSALDAAAGSVACAGRDGVHGAALDEILREMQSVARALPGGVW